MAAYQFVSVVLSNRFENMIFMLCVCVLHTLQFHAFEQMANGTHFKLDFFPISVQRRTQPMYGADVVAVDIVLNFLRSPEHRMSSARK